METSFNKTQIVIETRNSSKSDWREMAVTQGDDGPFTEESVKPWIANLRERHPASDFRAVQIITQRDVLNWI